MALAGYAVSTLEQFMGRAHWLEWICTRSPFPRSPRAS
jgi:hypothetical protein